MLRPGSRPLGMRLGLVPVGLLVVALAACDLLSPPPPQIGPTIAVQPGPWQAGPVAVPEHGAMLGAWVRPQRQGQHGRLTAIREFERELGRPLDIVHSYRRLYEPIGTSSDRAFIASGGTLMLSWAGGDSRDILAGTLDPAIREHARQVRDLGAPVLLRLRWEMDRPNLGASVWSPAEYIAAWRHVRRLFHTEGADNISWVWCPTAEGFEVGRAAAFYPGDDAVDWTCVDVYAGSELRPIGELLAPFLRWAAARPKPIMIGEYGVSRAWGSARRSTWLRDANVVFRTNRQIKAVLYFESNPDDRTESGEFRLSDDPPALKAFVETAADPWFNPRR